MSLWWNKININEEVIDFKMQPNAFGGPSSSPCNTFALKKTAIDNEKFREKAAIAFNENLFCGCPSNIPTKLQ